MQATKFNSLGIEFQYQTPSDITEFDTLAKKPGAALAEATRNVVYRGALPEIRDVFLHGREAVPASEGVEATFALKGVEQLTEIKRATKTVKRATKAEPDATAEVYDETEGDYFKRVLASLSETEGKTVEASRFASLMQSVADSVLFDPSASEPKERKPKTLPKAFSEKVAELHKNGKVDKALSVITKDLGKERVDAYHTAVAVEGTDQAKKDELLGWLIKEHAEWIAANKKGY